jgi:hypothetical protein
MIRADPGSAETYANVEVYEALLRIATVEAAEDDGVIEDFCSFLVDLTGAPPSAAVENVVETAFGYEAFRDALVALTPLANSVASRLVLAQTFSNFAAASSEGQPSLPDWMDGGAPASADGGASAAAHRLREVFVDCPAVLDATLAIGASEPVSDSVLTACAACVSNLLLAAQPATEGLHGPNGDLGRLALIRDCLVTMASRAKGEEAADAISAAIGNLAASPDPAVEHVLRVPAMRDALLYLMHISTSGDVRRGIYDAAFNMCGCDVETMRRFLQPDGPV